MARPITDRIIAVLLDAAAAHERLSHDVGVHEWGENLSHAFAADLMMRDALLFDQLGWQRVDVRHISNTSNNVLMNDPRTNGLCR